MPRAASARSVEKLTAVARNFVPRHRRTATGHREHNPERDKRQKLYRGNDTWRNFCSRFLKENPYCYACGEPAGVVDHLQPHCGDVALFELTGNHIPVCMRCHNFVTGKFDMRYRAGDSIEPKTKWLSEERMRNEILKNRKFPSVRVVGYR